MSDRFLGNIVGLLLNYMTLSPEDRIVYSDRCQNLNIIVVLQNKIFLEFFGTRILIAVFSGARRMSVF
jgi:hypothetical protein